MSSMECWLIVFMLYWIDSNIIFMGWNRCFNKMASFQIYIFILKSPLTINLCYLFDLWWLSMSMMVPFFLSSSSSSPLFLDFFVWKLKSIMIFDWLFIWFSQPNAHKHMKEKATKNRKKECLWSVTNTHIYRWNQYLFHLCTVHCSILFLFCLVAFQI